MHITNLTILGVLETLSGRQFLVCGLPTSATDHSMTTAKGSWLTWEMVMYDLLASSSYPLIDMLATLRLMSSTSPSGRLYSVRMTDRNWTVSFLCMVQVQLFKLTLSVLQNCSSQHMDKRVTRVRKLTLGTLSVAINLKMYP